MSIITSSHSFIHSKMDLTKWLHFLLLHLIILLKLVHHAQMAGGRGGAIATKGGTNRAIGPHVADPNDDSGSLSVILVVILPVAQMFFFVALIILVRMCYKKYCLKRHGTKCSLKNRNGPNYTLKTTNKCKTSVPVVQQQVSSIAMSSVPPMEVMSPVSAPRSKGATLRSVVVVDNDQITPSGSTMQTLLSNTSSASKVIPQPNGCLAHGVRCASNATGHSVSSTLNSLNHNGQPVSSKMYPFGENAMQAPVQSQSTGNSVTVVQHHIAPPQHQPQQSNCHANFVAPPHSMSLPAMTHYEHYNHQRNHQQLQQHLPPRSSTMIEAFECLNNEIIDSEPDDEVDELTTDEQVSSRHSSGHLSNCIFHQQYNRQYSSRPTSANSASTSTVSRCMQTY